MQALYRRFTLYETSLIAHPASTDSYFGSQTAHSQGGPMQKLALQRVARNESLKLSSERSSSASRLLAYIYQRQVLEHSAATCIQAHVKGHLTRLSLQAKFIELSSKAVVIEIGHMKEMIHQTFWTAGYAANVVTHKQAAETIQKVYRGWGVRRQRKRGPQKERERREKEVAGAIQAWVRAKWAQTEVETLRSEAFRLRRLREIKAKLLHIHLRLELQRWVQHRREQRCEAKVQQASAKCRYVQDFLSRLLSTESEASEMERTIATAPCRRKAPRLNRQIVRAVLSESLQELRHCRQRSYQVRLRNYPAR